MRRALAIGAVAAGLLSVPAPAEAPRCFGAASAAGCRNPALDRSVVPTPFRATRLPNAPCEPVDLRRPFVCAFGVPREEARRHVALVGDSHAVHWRAALGPVAERRGWHGSSLSAAGCPYSTLRPILPARLLPKCLQWRGDVGRWLRDHPEVDTIFVSQHRVRALGGAAAQQRGYLEAWAGLPRTVRRVVVIRDTPVSGAATRACVRRAIRARRPAGAPCARPRSISLHADPAADAVRRVRPRRVRLVDMTRFFCGPRTCPPVIGGALVHKDNTHITATYGATVAPYLGAALRRIGL